jgi:small subunit ribosomal protein S13
LARIAGVNLPREKRTEIGLTYILRHRRSTAHKVCGELTIDQNTKVRDLTDAEVARLRAYIDANLTVEGDLRRERSSDIKRLMEIGCYRGPPAPPGPPRPRSAHPHQRAHAQGPEEDRRRQRKK